MKKYIGFLLLIFTLSSCENFLDRPPLDGFSPSSYWSTESDLKGGINNLYTYMNHTWNEDIQSIDVYATGPNAISSSTHVASNSDAVYNNSYIALFKVHEFLDNYNKATVDKTIKDRYKGEALYFRAVITFNLLRRFGKIIIVDSKLGLDSPELYGKRNSRSEVIDFIINDLKESSSLLPLQSWITNNRPSENGRVTKGAAQALLARATLYEATHSKFHQHDVERVSDLLNLSIEASQSVISSGEYELESNIKDLFGPKGMNSKEIIISYRYTDKVENQRNPRHKVIAEGVGFAPTKYLVDAFLCDDGLPIELSPRFMGRESMDEEFKNRDPRMTNTVWVPFTHHPNIPNLPYVPDLRNNRVGYMFVKGMDETLISSGKESYTHEILYRLTEMYLIQAEAILELNNQISDSELDNTINILRMRSGMNVKLTNSFVSQNGLDMRQEIRRERRVELATEGFRYDDIIRWKEAENELIKPILGSKYYEEFYTEGTIDESFVSEEGFIIVQKADGRAFDKGKHYLFPLPLDELRKNPNLVQNQGWEN
ncbi:MAG: RagB/SusD family nutrient uptake outer membrane protein [Bacteroidales bacterium]